MSKKELIRVRGNKCEECGLGCEWNGKFLMMQLHDHKNEDAAKLLCPNCHSQTDTYCGRATWKNEDARIAFYDRHSNRMKQHNPMHDPSLRAKLSAAKKGRRLSEETKQKIRETMKRKECEKN